MTFTPMVNPPHRIDISVADSRDKDLKITEAVNLLIPVALYKRQGIAVIKHNCTQYAVEVSASVPCGSIQEVHKDEEQ